MRYAMTSIVGPTASGKSALADLVALRNGGCVVSADAMQVYRHMDIGTAKTPVGERLVPLYCIDLVEPSDVYSVALYSDDSHAAIDELLSQGKFPVVCGGTGLYVRAACEDMEFQPGDQLENPVRRHYEKLAEVLGADGLHRLLEERDPRSAELIHANNVRRVVRAFELLEQGSSYAEEHETLHIRQDRYPTLHIGLDCPREELYERIDSRVDRMMEVGLLDEVIRMRELGFADSLTARQAIGYKEMLSYLDGLCTLEDAVEDIKRGSRRYAKRQLTWFRSDHRIHWLQTHGRDASSLADEVQELLNGDPETHRP